MLLITYRCNLRCSYCYEPKVNGFSMSFAKAKQILSEQIQKLEEDVETLEIQFMGGEPLLEFNLIRDLATWLWSLDWGKRELILFAPTNGTLLNNEMRQWFTANKERFILGLSFDGDKTMQNINRSESSEKIDICYFANTWPNQSVKMTISPNTIGKIHEGVTFLHEAGFKDIVADLAMGENVKWEKGDLATFKTELQLLTEYYLCNPTFLPFSMLRMNLTALKKSGNQSKKVCGCGETLVCVDYTGETYACHLFSPVSIPLEKAQKSKQIYDFSDYSQFTSDTCKNCFLDSICNKCYGMNYICNGDVKSPIAFHCSAFKIMFAANCRYLLKKSHLSGDIKMEKYLSLIIKQIN